MNKKIITWQQRFLNSKWKDRSLKSKIRIISFFLLLVLMIKFGGIVGYIILGFIIWVIEKLINFIKVKNGKRAISTND